MTAWWQPPAGSASSPPSDWCLLPAVADEPIPPEVPARIALAVVWARKRRPLRAPLGILVIEHGRVTLLDQETAVQFDATLGELVVSRDGKWKVRLEADDETVYVSGLAVQEARTPATRELIERHNAVAVAPKPPSLSDQQWRRTLTGQHWATTATDVRSQKVVWQAALIGVFELAGATLTLGDPAA
jgi:hypothetical protein